MDVRIMREVSISEFRAKCLRILEEVSKTNTPIRVTRFGKPIVDVVPSFPVQRRAAWIGSMKGSMEIVGDILCRANEEHDWES
jgi:prevent-host-death family protein